MLGSSLLPGTLTPASQPQRLPMRHWQLGASQSAGPFLCSALLPPQSPSSSWPAPQHWWRSCTAHTRMHPGLACLPSQAHPPARHFGHVPGGSGHHRRHCRLCLLAEWFRRHQVSGAAGGGRRADCAAWSTGDAPLQLPGWWACGRLSVSVNCCWMLNKQYSLQFLHLIEPQHSAHKGRASSFCAGQ